MDDIAMEGVFPMDDMEMEEDTDPTTDEEEEDEIVEPITLDDVPPEIYEIIAAFVDDPRDLANLARTSSLWSIATRRVLYRNIHLKSSLQNVIYTLYALVCYPNIKSVVRSLRLETDWHWYHQNTGSWIDNNQLMQDMSNLSRIMFDGLPRRFTFPNEFTMFLQVVYINCPRLEEVHCIGLHWPQAMIESDWTPINVPSTLKTVAYYPKFVHPYMGPFFRNTFYTRLSSITRLEISILASIEGGADLFSLSFPNLQTFVGYKFLSKYSQTLALFFAGHSTISYLSILQSEAVFPCDELRAHIRVLPHLRSVSAHPLFIHGLSAICDSLRFIPSLHLDMTHGEDMADVARMIDEMVAKVGGFPYLKHCAVSGRESRFFNQIHKIIDSFSKESKELEWWTGAPFDDVDILCHVAKSLSRFPKLARVDLYEDRVALDPNEPFPSQLKAFEHIARNNMALRRIYLYMPIWRSWEISGIYVVLNNENKGDISRATNDVLQLIYRFPQGGPYIQPRQVLNWSSADWELNLPYDSFTFTPPRQS